MRSPRTRDRARGRRPDAALPRAKGSGYALVEPLQGRPWGLRDFRIADLDGYCIRVTTAV